MCIAIQRHVFDRPTSSTPTRPIDVNMLIHNDDNAQLNATLMIAYNRVPAVPAILCRMCAVIDDTKH